MKITEDELKHHLTNKTQSEIDYIIGEIREAEGKPRHIISGTLEEVLEHIRNTNFAERRKRK